MSHRTKLIKELESSGYVFVRHNKHIIYKNAIGETIAVPNHNKMNEFTYRSLMKKIGKSK